MYRAAQFSKCRQYRYALWRRWGDGPQVLFIMLNPSTADEKSDDPTIQRCLDFAQSWGFGALVVGNLFAYRTVSPSQLKTFPEPVGADNQEWLARLHADSQLVIAAWGNHGRLMGRSTIVRSFISDLHCLGVTKLGEPKHPLYISSDTEYIVLD